MTDHVYRDAARPIDERVRDLVARMTVPEKIAQLGSIWSFTIVAGETLDRERLAELVPVGIGEITRLAGGTNLRAAETATVGNEIQRYLVEETRLGIPAIFHEESLHGVLAWGAPCFQQSIGAAATWDPGLVEAVAQTIRRRLLAMGARHSLAPVLDIARDPRWGRIEETYGEDPYLAATMGSAYVRGLQGDDLADGVIATGKHLVGHGLAEGGRNQGPVHVGSRELHDEQLFPFEAAIGSAGLASVMPAYCEVDGVPCHASRELLSTILRDRWAFDGLVASDYIGIEQLVGQHQLTTDLGVAASLALDAGVDLELPRSAAYAEPLERALADGTVDMARLDATVSRVLRAKFRLGLFERPYVEPPSEAVLAEMATAERTLGRELARRSLVLVQNDGALPLARDVRRVAVIGPIAASARELLGDYSHLLHIETLLEIRKENDAFGFAVGDRVVAADELAGRRTILDVLRERLTGAEVRYARGTGIGDGSDAEIEEAVAGARSAEVAIVVLGERSGLTLDSTTGESRDRRDLGFFGRQQELLEAVVATGTPVVLVVVSGRPLAIEWAASRCAAILLAWVPGDEGPEAIADILLGDSDPGGKLPVTIPRHVGQVPLYYGHRPSGGRSQWRGDYVDGSHLPLWSFGHGLSYSRFEIGDLTLDRATLGVGDEVAIEVDVANVGDRTGDEVVQLYVRDLEASVSRPIKELRGFARVRLEPDERRRVAFRLAAEQLAFTSLDGRLVVEPGRIAIMVGSSSANLPCTAELEIVGPPTTLARRRRFFTTVEVEPETG